MTLADFRRDLVAAIEMYFPHAKWNLSERRGIELQARLEIDARRFISIYHSAATDKTSYALIENGARIFGYDNSRFWHCHPIENPTQHHACSEPTSRQVMREMKELLE